ncbi:MAG: Ig-like domain-containing protein [Spirochaetaceae bacterium]|jgi:hypothetical protein|nr:Ig-like domain-containing protein [Spirochaetaceae bacterium]
MMIKRVLVGLFAAMAVLFASCEDVVSGGPGTNEPGTDNPGTGVVKVTGVSLSLNVLFLALEDSADLAVTVSPADAADKTVTWVSSDTHVATVDENGTVASVAEGTATITVTTNDGGKTATCAVTVYPSVTVASTADWTAALSAISGEKGGSEDSPRIFGLRITDDFSVAGIVTGSSVAGNYKEIRLTGDKTVSLDANGSLIRTAANQTFVIDGPVLQGKTENDSALVYIDESSTVELRRGEIKDNDNSSGYGGGVHVNDGTFAMKGGTVSGNEAEVVGGGVFNNGTFTMQGGYISENEVTDDYGIGGGVYNNGTFTMEGGTISENTVKDIGGGVFNNGTFTMEDGYISKNEATGEESIGGGVSNDGTFTMKDGTVTGNAASIGGGMIVFADGTLTMKGGAISGNEAEYGGGVHIWHGGTFTMEGGAISSNKATADGGGVFVEYTSTFTMKDGTITSNTAISGGGVFVYDEGTFTMEKGTITGNTASTGKKGVEGAFTKNGGTVQED